MFSKVYSSHIPKQPEESVSANPSSLSYSRLFRLFQYQWEEKDTVPFDELILSWNGIRPKKGKWTFFVSLKEGEWLPYAEWSTDSQRSFKSDGEFAKCYQDAVTPKEICSSFKIKVEGEDLSSLKSMTVCLSLLSRHEIVVPAGLESVRLNGILGQSQLVLDHPRNKDLCSPTATSTAVNYLLGTKKIDPLCFAARSYDAGFDIYGNWILNVAEAFHVSEFPCHVERLNNFEVLHGHLKQGRPVVVSVKGTIPGAPKPYPSGHLMCIVGYEGQKVHCVDSGFSDNDSSLVSYDLEEFLKAWGVRKNLAYVFNVYTEIT